MASEFLLARIAGCVPDRPLKCRCVGSGLEPKHAGMLNVLAANGPPSQAEMAQILRVAPSLVVALADHLESLGAIERLRAPEDRHRQNLNSHGRVLLRKCLDVADAVDAETTADRARRPTSHSRPARRSDGSV
ncbi:MarR family transcriptional regulator [Nocardia sp. NPDC051990]|uniref:MarR family winged helix-turn-helix transcriptional regulator n=1 Tax=Nocardia sp. NPDC051990 TaxID=3155285 RepID=UPI0034170C24